jgi:hypothetical protein
MEAYHWSLRLRQQSYPVHARFPRGVNDVSHVLKIDIIVTAHERYSLGANLEDVVQTSL